MAIIEIFKDLLTSTNQIHYSSINEFLPLDLVRIKKNLRIAERATENGSRELPSTTSDELDDVESEIINTIEAERSRCLNEFNSNLTTYNQRLSNLNIQTRLSQVTLASRQALGDFKVQIMQAENDLIIPRQKVKEHTDTYYQFKKKNHLTRPAKYPVSKLLYYGIVGCLFLIESVLNGSFLSIGNEFGLLGGFLEAIFIASLNIVFAILIGLYIIPLIFHSNIGLKLMGVLLTFSLLIFNVLFNICVAHYRNALVNNMSDQAVKVAWNTFINMPLDLADFKSWMMVLVGCLFALFALIDGFKMDDPYPGYGTIERGRHKAYEIYANQKSDLLEDLQDTRDFASDALTQLKEDLVKRRQEHDVIIASRHNLLMNLNIHHNYLDGCCRELISFYRAKNRDARLTEAPKYFDRPINLNPRFITPIIPIATLSDEDLNEVMAEANSIIQSAIHQVMDAFDTAISELDQIDEIINLEETPNVKA